jgi:nitrite reductase/ring-hydroxylating ferredoxin subunit
VRPQDSKYLFLYPFVKTRAWYKLPHEQRQEMMTEHVRMGRKYPDIRINTAYSFGLDDQEFMVGFEGDDPGEFLDLVMELRESEASAYTLQDTPIFTCIQMSLWDVLDSLGGASASDLARAAERDAEGFVAVATVAELPPGSSKRVYNGADAIALFNVAGEYYAVSDRCSHGRASLSEGSVGEDGCTLNCPWHGGQFDIQTGEPAGGPVRVAIKTYRVKVEGDRVLVG